MSSRSRRKSMDEEQGFGDYTFIKTLGEGSFGKVKLAVNIHTGDKCAVKIMEKSRLDGEDDMVRAMREVQVLSLIRHKHIARLYDVSHTPSKIYLVMEFCEGGELFDYIVAHRRIKEREARGIFREILSALAYCHRNFIIHRDLKPENLLLDADKHIKIIDFGFANTFHDQELLNTFCGSPAYAAPEMVIGKEYLGPQVDIWSLGVLLFAIVCGHLPFDDPNVNNLFQKIVRGSFKFPSHLSDECKDLISKMLVVKPTSRASLDELFVHPWVLDGFDGPPDDLIPERPPVEDIDEDAKKELLEIGFPEEELESALADNTNGITLCAYYLLLEKRAHDEAEAEALRQALASKTRGRAGSRSIADRRKSLEDGDAKRARTPGGTDLEAITEDKALKVDKAAAAGGSNKRRKRPRRHSVAVGGELTEAIDQIAEDFVEKDARVVKPRNRAPVTEIPEREGSSPSGKRKGKGAATSPAPASPAGSEGGDALPEIVKPRQRKRRFSLDAAMSSVTAAFQKKPAGKAPLRVVKGPFSVATTSSNSPEEMMEEVERVLGENNIEFNLENYLYDCHSEIDGNALRFQIEICKLERLTLNGLRLKRVTGDTWAYKRQCLLLLSQMKM